MSPCTGRDVRATDAVIGSCGNSTGVGAVAGSSFRTATRQQQRANNRHVAMSQSSQSHDKSPVPANLRFQRRTSERAFYEGAFKPGTMDYSQAISHDPDHPAGSSPWGSNSPQQTRHESMGSDVPHTSLPQSAFASDRPSIDQLDRPSTATSENGDSNNSPYSPQSQSQSQYYAQQQQQQQQYGYQQRQQSYQQQNPSYENSQPQRYHGNPRLQAQVQQQQQAQQPQKPPMQYKLQIKITGLERSGRKDAVFVFDAHVSQISPIHPIFLPPSRNYLLTLVSPTRPTSPASAPPSSEPSVAPTRKSKSTPTT